MIKYKNIILPKNKNFGFFVVIILFITSIVFYYNDKHTISIILITVGSIAFAISLLFPKILYPFNKLWMLFGWLIGLVITPIIMGIIFFLIFTPISVFMKLVGRDELALKNTNKHSFWRNRIYKKEINSSFYKQY